MKTTQYFKHTKTRPDRAAIQDIWIENTVANPQHELQQADGRFKRWLYIDSEAKYLRVIVLEDGETVHNAFFDRGFKP